MSEAETSKHIKRKDLSLADKILVIDELEKKTLQSTVAKKFGISQSQVSRILKSKKKLFSAHRSNKNPTRKRARKSTQEDVEDALLQWFKQAKSRGLIITGPMLREKVKNFGKIMNLNFDPSSSWVTRWRERDLIVFKRKHGEKQDHDFEAAENWIASVWPKKMSAILPQKFTTVMKRGFTFMHYQRELCALKMTNSLVARSQKNV